MLKIKELRIKNGITQEELGRMLGVQKAAICKYENESVQIPHKYIRMLCCAFNVSADELLGLSEKKSTLSEDDECYIGIPLLGSVHAGSPMYSEENIAEYIPCSISDISRGSKDDYFYMQVVGDCMTGDFIPEGARVLVQKTSRLNNNEIGIVRVEDEVLVRHVKLMDNCLVLIASNPKYEPMIITGGDIEIIGRVVEIRFKV